MPGLEMDTVADVRLIMPENLANVTNNRIAQGRVEIKVMGIWGTICDDFWDLNDGRVICKSVVPPCFTIMAEENLAGTVVRENDLIQNLTETAF